MAETVADLGEFGLIRRIDELLRAEGERSRRVSIGIGDDTASFRPRAGAEVLVTCDCLVEGRHYLPARIPPFALGRRAMAINISDIGAMGGWPLYALVSLGLRATTPVAEVESLYRGFLAELNPFGACVIGGNLTKIDGAQFIDVTLIGEVKPGTVLRRSTARPGDAVLVTGYPGQAAAGLGLLLGSLIPPDAEEDPVVRAYTTPCHRAREGRAVAEAGCGTAMIDTSDGFLGDLRHLCEESGVGAKLIRDHLPVSDALLRASEQLGKDPYELVLGESDDYELIITCSPDCEDRVRAAIASVSSVAVTLVGWISEDRGDVVLVLPGGLERPLTQKGWDHFSS